MKTNFAKVSILMAFAAILSSFGSKKDIPPSTVAVNASLYADVTEVSNIDWVMYLYWLSVKNGKSSETYLKALPDTTIWTKVNQPYINNYLRHKAFLNYPVVGIRYEQAVTYLQWRSERENEMLLKKKIKMQVTYRLPSEKEWEAIASVGFSEKTKKKLEKSGLFSANLTYGVRDSATTAHAKIVDLSDFTAPTKSYMPNALGIYNLIGNVAEMTSEKGLAKGGGFIHKKEECSVTAKFNYTKPEIWLGFRAVCEVKK